VPVVLLDPGPHGMPGLSIVDLTTFAEDVVHASCFQARVILDGLKETGDHPSWEIYSKVKVKLSLCF